MAATASQSNLSGLPRRLVQDGIVTEEVIQEAAEAARKAKIPLVAYLVANEKATSGNLLKGGAMHIAPTLDRRYLPANCR